MSHPLQSDLQPDKSRGVGSKSRRRGGATQIKNAVWLPIPLFIILLSILSLLDLHARFEPPYLLAGLNVVFLTLVSWIVAYLAARSYIASGTRAVLLLGNGMWILGIACAVAAAFGFFDMDANVVTVHNCGSFLAGLSIFLSALSTTDIKGDRTRPGPLWWLAVSYIGALAAMIFITLGLLDGLIPPFFVPGSGATPLRQVVVILSAVQFLISAVLFGLVSRNSETGFMRWYSIGLALIAIGLFGVIPETQLGSPINWAARLAQYIGGIYILLAVFTVFRRFHSWGIPVGRALYEIERRHRSLVDLNPDAILVHAEGKYVYANPAASRLFGARTPEEIIGKNVLDLVSPEYRGLARERIQQAYAGAVTPLRETRFIRFDGKAIDVESTGVKVEFRGKPAIQIVVRDITERKRAQAVKARYELISQYARDPLLLVGLDGKIVEGNKAAEDFYGYTREELLRLFIYDLRRSDDLDTIKGQLEEARTRGILFEAVHLRKDRTPIPVEISSRGVVIEGQEMLLSVVRDITVRKQAEEALCKAKDELDQRVKERTEQLSRTVDALNDEVVQRTVAEKVLTEQSEQLRLLTSELTLAEQRERQRLAQVLHDGLQQILVGAKFGLARIERSRGRDLQQAVYEVRDLIDDAIETSRSLTAELCPPVLREFGLIPALEWLARWMHDRHGLTLDLEAYGQENPEAEDVNVLLFQATRELLFNVVKHAGVKTARVRVVRQADEIRVTVSDQGTGFNPSMVRGAGGSTGGFGLFSIRERLLLLGGKMEIDSTPGHGCRIMLNAPARALEEKGTTAPIGDALKVSVGVTPATRADADPAESRIRVLLVDDHIVMRQGLARLLQDAPDMEIVGEASDGESAVRLVREILPDVVLMDISMPGMNGIEATKVIHSEFPDVRIVGLSMFEEEERAAAMQQAGASAYVTKSGPSDAVIATIRACVCATQNTN